jgi:hypothetical protein
MPLLQIIEYIPAIQRTDGIVKGLIKKIEDNDSRVNRIVNEKMIDWVYIGRIL